METCYYETDKNIPVSERDCDRIPWKYFLRQILVCSAICVTNFSYGLTLGSPTIFIAQIRREANSSDAVSIEMESWLSSSINYSGSVCAIILAILAKVIGRKLCFLFVCITYLISYIILYYSTNTAQILISEILHGPMAASPLTVSTMILTEYTSPRYRGIFLTLKSAVFLFGIWIANTIGTFFHWKNIQILALICSVYTFLTVLLWPDSPYWLASKNRFEDCAASHRWLKGSNKISEEELATLLETRKIVQPVEVYRQNFHRPITKMFRSKSFYKPVSLSLLVVLLYHFSGKFACSMYAVEIIKRITGTESTAYTGMLILDGITVLGAYVGCVLARIFKRRSLLLTSSTTGVAFLFSLAFYLYFINLKIISENTIVSMALLVCYSLAISVGPMIMSTTVLGELIPVKYRSTAVLLFGCFNNFISGCIIKICPFILHYSGARGLFMIFAVIETVLIGITYKVLPETKDKTILEIQKSLLDKKSKIKSIDAHEERLN